MLIAFYRPIIRAVLNARVLTVSIAVVVLALSAWPLMRIGSEFMPTLNEGTLFYMPTTLPGLSVTKAARTGADAEQDHQIVSGSGLGVRQGGARGDRDRSGAARNVRDRGQSETRERMARRHDDRQADRRDGREPAIPRRQQRLDDADQGAHRHAVDRHPHARRA